jgi:type II restriction enzyme
MLSDAKKQEIIETIIYSIRDKLTSYSPETSVMPFHIRLLGRDRMALFSFLQSLNTTFGTTIYEPVAISLAGRRFIEKKRQKAPETIISSEAHIVIQQIMDELTAGNESSNKKSEISRIRAVCQKGEAHKVKLTKVDVYLRSADTVYMFDIKSVKPNIGEFKGFKRTLLEWVAAQLYVEPDINIVTGLAIPYNPYEPKPYERWTMQGIFDLPEEVLVAKEWWNFLAGDKIYEDLLHCFETAGIQLRKEIDQYFERFENQR